jgi:hypothetical protein
LSLLLSSCGGGGGGGGSGSASTPFTDDSNAYLDNVIPVNVTLGLSDEGVFFPNQSFVSVVVCEVNTSNCVTIDKVLVDTGSFGLRLFDSAISSLRLNSSIYQGNGVYQCAVFASGYTSGRVALVDLKLGALKATDLPIQIIDSQPKTVPRNCTQSGVKALTRPNQLGSNGVLGVGPLAYDGEPLKVYYYFLSGGQAVNISSLPNQWRLPQPVSKMNRHNNGLILTYPLADSMGALGLTGQMIFGLNTASNNSTSGATFFTTSNAGRIKVAFDGQSYDGMIDSGANHNVFTKRSFPTCGASDFFCPPTPQSVNVSVSSYSGIPSKLVSIQVADYTTYGGSAVQPGLAGYAADNYEFILGLPFMYGRQTYIAIQGQTTGAVPQPAIGLSP